MTYTVNSAAALSVGRKNLQALSGNVQRLSSGNRFTRAADDVASLSVATKIASELASSRTALSNISQASSLLDVANGGIDQVKNILQRQQQLATQANSGALSATERQNLNIEFQNLSNEINRIAQNTNFAGTNLLDGSLGTSEANVSLDNTVANYNVTGTLGNGAIFDNSGGTVDTGGSNSGVDISGINDTNFQGELSGFNAVYDYDGNSNTLLSVDVNGTTYTAALNTGGGPLAGGSTITFSGNGGASTFTIDTATGVNLANQTDANNLSSALDSAFDGVEFSQERTVTSFDVSGFTPADALNGATATLNGGDINLADNTAGNIGPFTVQDTSASGSGDASISVVIDGETYTASGLGDAGDNINGAITLQNQSDPSKNLTINLANPVYLGNDAAASGLQDELNTAFDVGTGSSGGNGLTVQTGSSAGDTISLGIGSVTTNSLFNGQSLDISTAAGAASASSILGSALNTLSGVQAEIGSAQSRLDFAFDNVTQEITNTAAAFSQLADTDIASESSAFAKNQLQQNAGIAVLAQSNKLSNGILGLLDRK